MSQIEVDEIYPKEEVYPMLVNFQNGYATEEFASQCLFLNNSNTNSKTVATKIDGVVYAGDEEDEELGKTYILTRHKTTGKVRLFESGVVNLKPMLKIKSTPAPVLETSRLELSRKFGSKKQKQQMEHIEKLKVSVETVTEQMSNVTQEIAEDTLDLSSYNKTTSDDFYIPPINRAADKAEAVYDINNILTDEQYEKIYSELEGKEYESEMLPVVKDIISKRALTPKLTVLSIYANSLIHMYNTIAREVIKKGHTVCQYSVTLNNLLMNKFTDVVGGRKSRPTSFKDKSLCHAIVFLLLINNLKIDLEPLCEAIKMTPATVSNKVRVTGATVINSGNKKVIQLKLPLNKFSFRRRSTKF